MRLLLLFLLASLDAAPAQAVAPFPRSVPTEPSRQAIQAYAASLKWVLDSWDRDYPDMIRLEQVRLLKAKTDEERERCTNTIALLHLSSYTTPIDILKSELRCKERQNEASRRVILEFLAQYEEKYAKAKKKGIVP